MQISRATNILQTCESSVSDGNLSDLKDSTKAQALSRRITKGRFLVTLFSLAYLLANIIICSIGSEAPPRGPVAQELGLSFVIEFLILFVFLTATVFYLIRKLKGAKNRALVIGDISADDSCLAAL